MAVSERDPHTGHMTTGHEWNGIKELNTPVPKLVWISLIITISFAVVYWILMPAWPLGVTYTKGLLGIDQRDRVAESLRDAAEARSVWTSQISERDFADIRTDEALMEIVRNTGATLFADNCAVCHGPNGGGGPGFPNLADGAWLWGGTPEHIMETLRVGINSTHEETRVAEMMAFGRDQILMRTDVLNVVAYVRSLSDPAVAQDERDAVTAGKTVFAEQCVACHGEDGKGNIELGAPNLTDKNWIYGGSKAAIFETIWNGRKGWMPAWETRMSETDRKLLTLYIGILGTEEPK